MMKLSWDKFRIVRKALNISLAFEYTISKIYEVICVKNRRNDAEKLPMSLNQNLWTICELFCCESLN